MTEHEEVLQARLSNVEAELNALRLAYDDLRRAHERVVDSPGWKILGQLDAFLARIPLARRLATTIRAGQGAPGNGGNGWVPRLGLSASPAEQLRILRESPFFDGDWYKATYTDLPATMDPAEHYFLSGARERRRGGPLFNTQWYLANNPDVAADRLNPVAHFHLTGAREGRTPWTSADLLEWQSPSIQDVESALTRVWRKPHDESFLDRAKPVALYVSSVGNFFFRELAVLCEVGLQEAGYRVDLRSELDAPPRDGETALVLAPHEFYYLGKGVGLAENPAFATSIPIGTEQWQTTWFSRALPFMLRAKRVLDINVQSADAFARLGVNARWLALGYSPGATSYETATRDAIPHAIHRLANIDPASLSTEVRPLKERPIDILFVGARSPRRNEIVAGLTPMLASLNAFVHFTDPVAPLRADEHVNAALFTLLARNSRVLLNIHQTDMPYFEWQRIVLSGIWQRSLVITETCFDVPFLRAGSHYVGVRAASIGQAIGEAMGAIERDEPGPQHMVDEARHTLQSRYALRDCLLAI